MNIDSTRSKIFLRVPQTNETKKIFYRKITTTKPAVVIRDKKYMYFHTSSKVIKELLKISGVKIEKIPITHNSKVTSLYGMPCKIHEMEIKNRKYDVISLGGVSRDKAWRKALHILDKIKTDYGIDLEICEKDKLEEDIHEDI